MELMPFYVVQAQLRERERERHDGDRGGKGQVQLHPIAAHLIFILFHARYCMSSVCNEWVLKWSGGDERMEQKGRRERVTGLIRLSMLEGEVAG